MIGEIQEYFNMINDLRDQVKQQLEGLSREALDWRPTSSDGELATNSMAVIAAHVAGSEPFWMKEIVGGQPIHRDRARSRRRRATRDMPPWQGRRPGRRAPGQSSWSTISPVMSNMCRVCPVL